MNIEMKVGFAKIDTTPDYPTPLGGYGMPEKRIHNNVLNPLYAICVAVSDGEKTVLLFNLDQTGFPPEMVEECASRIEKAYGIPKEQILFNSTHTHSAPAFYLEVESIKKYKIELCDKIVEVVPHALADLSPAKLTIGSGKIEGCNFVRRYLLSDGSYGGDNFGDFVNNVPVAHETEADNTMQVIRWVREDKKDVVMVNWQAHPHRTGGATKLDLSSDLVDVFRNKVEEEHDVLCAFYQGCAGNLNSHSRLPMEKKKPSHITVGEELAEGIKPILAAMRPVKADNIRIFREDYEGEVNHYTDHLVPLAQEVKNYMETAPNLKDATRFANSKGFNSVYHANAIINRSGLPNTEMLSIGALSFGDVCIVHTPNELYDEVGLHIKGTSPFEMTFVLGYTNGRGGYMPTIKAFYHGGYGCDTCRFPAGETEKLTNRLIEIVTELKK